MTIVLAHGALGYWDEVGFMALVIGGLLAGLTFALWGRASGGGPTPPPADDSILAGQPLVKTAGRPPTRC